MTSRVPPRIRQAIIEFSDEPARGEVSRFCRSHGISRAVFYKIRAQAVREGAAAALLPRSTAPARQARQTSGDLEEKALEIRMELTRGGWDAGPLSVAAAMRRRGLTPPSRASLARIFARRGLAGPAPEKRPRSSWRRFAYSDPNGCWQLDGMDFTLDSGVVRCILQVEDDHSRKVLSSLVAVSENGDAAIAVVADAIARYGAPARFLTDNGTAFNQSRRGTQSRLEKYLKARGVEPITGRPAHPTTQGKNERLHQTLQKFLDANRPIYTVKRLRHLVDQFDDYYNNQRPHQALSQPGQVPDTTPAQAYEASPKAHPSPTPITTPTPVKTWTFPIQPTRHTPGRATPLDGSPTLWQADRRVSSSGVITICHARIFVGKRRTGTTLHTQFDDTTITVIDSDGLILGTVPRPDPGTTARYTLTAHDPDHPQHATVHELMRHNCPRSDET